MRRVVRVTLRGGAVTRILFPDAGAAKVALAHILSVKRAMVRGGGPAHAALSAFGKQEKAAGHHRDDVPYPDPLLRIGRHGFLDCREVAIATLSCPRHEL